MKIIKTLRTFTFYGNLGEIDLALLDLMEHDFLEADREAFLPNKEPDEHFKLEDYGYLVILEPGESEAELKLQENNKTLPPLFLTIEVI